MNPSPAPVSVVHAAVQRAVSFLRAAKVEYAIVLPDGEVLGDLPIMPKKGKRAGWRKENDWNKDIFPGYVDQIKAMQPGDVLTWTVGDPAKTEKFRASVTGTAGKHLPKNGFITTVTGDKRDTVEILRVE